MRSMFRGIARPVRRLWYRFITLKSSPERIAGGLALGIFVGLTPTFGVQMVLVSFAAMLLRVNLFAALIGVYITNPVTVLPIYLFNYRVGAYLLGVPPVHVRNLRHVLGEGPWYSIFGLSVNFLTTLWIGSLIVAIPTTILSYVLMLRFVHQSRSLRSQRRLKRLEQLLDRTEAPPAETAAPESEPAVASPPAPPPEPPPAEEAPEKKDEEKQEDA